MPSNILLLQMRYRFLQKRLIEMAEEYGRTDPRVVACSKKLDKVVVQLQRRMAV